MLRLSQVRKSFGEREALSSLSLELERGEIFGLLGPNGAGKSTLVGIASGVLQADSGSVALGAEGPPHRTQTRRCLGVAPQEIALYEQLSGEENLHFFARIQGVPPAERATRVDWALDFVGLQERRGDRLAHYSGGMARRLNLAAAILHQPRLLLLDEPTVGVDPQSRNLLLERIVELRDRGCTVLYTTHYMEEASRICDRLGVIDEGKLLASDTVDGLVRRHGGPPILEVEIKAQTQTQTQTHEENGTKTLRIEDDDPIACLRRLEASHELLSFKLEQPSLEQVFLSLTGRSLRD